MSLATAGYSTATSASATSLSQNKAVDLQISSALLINPLFLSFCWAAFIALVASSSHSQIQSQIPVHRLYSTLHVHRGWWGNTAQVDNRTLLEIHNLFRARDLFVPAGM